jgi:hypothetical protein
MSEARVENIESLKAFKRALWRFAETANAAMADADAEAIAVHRWLEADQRQYWAINMRKAQELVGRCEEALRHKKIFKDASGRTPSAVDEEKALAKARRMLEHATQRFENVRRYTPRLEREIMLYKGQVQRLTTFLAGEIPTASAKLDKMIDQLEAYVNLTPADAGAAGMMNLPAESVAEESSATDGAQMNTDEEKKI